MIIENTHKSNGTPPVPMSEPCAQFFVEHAKFFVLHHFIMDVAMELDRVRHIARNALNDSQEPEPMETWNELKGYCGAGYFQVLPFLTEITYCRYVDNFLYYLSEFLRIIFLTNTNMLKSNETLTAEEIIKCQSIEEIMELIAEKRLTQINYKGIRDFEKYVRERLGFELFHEPGSLDAISLIVEIRNLVTHNQGIVNKLFVKRIPDGKWNVGEKVKLSAEDLIAAVNILSKSVSDIEIRGAAIYKYKQPITSIDELIAQMFTAEDVKLNIKSEELVKYFKREKKT